MDCNNFRRIPKKETSIDLHFSDKKQFQLTLPQYKLNLPSTQTAYLITHANNLHTQRVGAIVRNEVENANRTNEMEAGAAGMQGA